MRRGFSLIELIFVIVVIGILAKFGTNLMMTVYKAYTASTINNRLQVDAELALKQISNRLQYRIKDSVVARTPLVGFSSLSSAGGAETVLEWIGYDIDGWLGLNNIGGFNAPTWSGFIDLDTPAAVAATTFLNSPGSNTNDINTVIQAMASNGSPTSITDAAIFFTGANSDILSGYGWNGIPLANQTGAAHPIQGDANVTRLVDVIGTSFAGVDIYENYKLAWTAYALSIEDNDGDGDDDLVLYYDYQPWETTAAGLTENYAVDGTAVLILPNVDTFKFSAVGDTIKVQICVNEQNTLGEGRYAICKETAIF